MGFRGNVYRRIRKALLPAYRTVKATFKYILNKITAAGRVVIDYVIKNPWKFGISSILIVGGVLVIVVPLAVGFGSGGVAIGSSAAAWQASIGNVAPGSHFAVLQSLAMTGVFNWIGAVMIIGGLAIPVLGYFYDKFFGGGDDTDKKDS